MRSSREWTRTAAQTVRLVARLLRARPVAARSRWVAVALALSFGLSALGPCLCEPDLDSTPAAHACCAPAPELGSAMTSAGTLIRANGMQCCPSHTAAAVAEPVAEREVQHPAAASAAVSHTASDRVLASSRLGVTTASPPLFSSPPSTVLRV